MTWAPSYSTAANLRTYMRMDAVTGDATDIAQDTLVHTPALAAASREIDRATGRQFGQVASAEDRYYTARWDPVRQKYAVEVDDIGDVTGLAVHVDFDGSGAYATSETVSVKLPYNAILRGKVYTDLILANATRNENATKVTALYGWTSVPPAITEACLLQASRIVKRRDAPFGIAGSPDLGNEIRLLAQLDPDVQRMIAPYRRYIF